MQIKIMKLNGTKVLKAKRELSYTYTQCSSDEIISLSESQLLMWLFGGKENFKQTSEQYSELKGQRTMSKSKSEVARLTAKMNELQFTDKIVQLEITNKQAVKLIREGFKLNGCEYRYVLSKGGQTITFAREDVWEDLHKRINNGRDMSVKFIPAKMNAYLSLTSTSSKWVPQPRKVVVVDDVVNKFTMPYLYVGEEGIEERCDETTLEATDGAGMISVELMKKWSEHLGYGDKISSGMSIRNSFVKGMVFPIDFHKYFEDRNVDFITDVWGNQVRVADVDMIITSSMHKGWKCYNSMEHYEQCCEANGYQYRICKESHEVRYGSANYQMTIDLDITDEQIERLIQPSIDWMESLLTDWRFASLYLHGRTQSVKSKKKAYDSLADLIHLDHKFVEDRNIHQIIRSNLNGFRQELKRGSFLVNSSYQIIAPDLYQLCEELAGVEQPKGLLKVGEVYSQYHADMGKQEAVLFRAPQINRYNNARVELADSEELREFYKYCNEVVVLNNHDLICETLAGAD